MTMGENKTEMAIQGKKAAILGQDGAWQSAEESSNTEGRGRFAGMMARNFKAPTAQAADLVGFTKELKKDGDAYAGDLTKDGIKQLLSFDGTRGRKHPQWQTPRATPSFG